jgi:DNA-binding GntR family transcriptional regulator
MDPDRSRNESVKKPTATERVYEALRQDILTGRFAEGEHLTELRLCKELGVSRTPIRAALQRLTADGFLTLTSHSGAAVRGWSIRDTIETFQIRAQIESLACGLAARNPRPSDLERLHMLCNDMEEARHGSLPRLSELNKAFHGLVVTMGDNRALAKLCINLMDIAFMVRSYGRFSAAQVDRSLQFHRDIVRAIDLRHPELAEALMKAHILSAMPESLSDPPAS